MNGLVAVVGGSGFVGRYVVQALCRAGARVRVICRRPETAQFLKPLGGLGQIQIVRGDVTRPESIARALAGCDGVINLAGILAGDFAAVQADGAEAVAKAAAGVGATALVHVSAIGADPRSASRYGRSKGEGEARVRAAFPNATILRPSVIFGPEDNFTNRFARLVRCAPVVPVLKPATKFQPVWVGDVAAAATAAATAPDRFGGRLFELGGPATYSFHQLIALIKAEIGSKRMLIDLPDAVAEPFARLAGLLPGAPITWDQWLMLQRDNVVAADAEGLSAFGIIPAPLEAKAATWLVQYRRQGRFTDLRTTAESAPH